MQIAETAHSGKDDARHLVGLTVALRFGPGVPLGGPNAIPLLNLKPDGKKKGKARQYNGDERVIAIPDPEKVSGGGRDHYGCDLKNSFH
jgi:hypothetical protein